MVVERSQPPAINNLPRLVNDINPLRPGGVRTIGGVAHQVDADRNREVKTLHEIVRNRHAFRKRLRLGIADALIDVRLHLPFILRMGLADVHGKEIRAVFVLLINLDEISNLAAEGRSSVAAEDQHQRPLADPVVQVEGGAPIEGINPRVRRAVSDA